MVRLRFHTNLDNKHFYYKYKYRKPKQNIYWDSGYDNGLEMKGPYFLVLNKNLVNDKKDMIHII